MNKIKIRINGQQKKDMNKNLLYREYYNHNTKRNKI